MARPSSTTASTGLVHKEALHVVSFSSTAAGLRRSAASPHSVWLRHAGHALLLGVACCLGELAARLLWSWQAGTHALAVAPPLLLAFLILQPRRQWPLATVAAFAGTALALRLADASWAEALVLAAGPLVPSWVMAWVARRWSLPSWPPANLWQGLVFLLGAGLLLPLFNVNWMLGWSQRFDFAYYRVDLGSLLLAQVSGYLLLVPLLLGVARPPPAISAPTPFKLSIAAVLLVVPALLWAMPELRSVPSALMTVAALPLLLWMLVEFGLIGVSAALLSLAVLGIRLSLEGVGPFSGLPIARATHGLQAWICVMAAAMWVMAVLLTQKRQESRRLRDAYRQLSDLAGRILVVQEEERTRIARELHDDINQQLAAVSIRLSYLKRGGDDAQREAVAQIQQDVLKASNDIRGMSHELHPSVLRFTGLGSALSAFCQHHGNRTTLHIDCRINAPEGLDGDQELGLFRIVQEAVNNIEKHARAGHAWVRLDAGSDVSVLSISDDGVGMAGAGANRPGLGMISMEERARLLGGSLRVESQAGGGTRIEVCFPNRRPSA